MYADTKLGSRVMFSSLLITTFFLPRNGTNVGDTSTEASEPLVDAELVFTRSW